MYIHSMWIIEINCGTYSIVENNWAYGYTLNTSQYNDQLINENKTFTFAHTAKAIPLHDEKNAVNKLQTN